MAAAALLAASAAGAAQFWELPWGGQVTGISADGGVVVGITSGGAFRWTPDGYTILPGASADDGMPVVSADGAVVAATVDCPHPDAPNATVAVWNASAGGGWRPLAGRPRPAAAYGIAPDASVVVGLSAVSAAKQWPQGATAWRADGSGAALLNCSVPGSACRANVASAGGAVIGGWQDSAVGARQGCVWRGGVQEILADAQGQPVGEVLFASADGAVLAGYTPADGTQKAWVLPRGAATPRALPGASSAFGATADGAMVVGAVGGGFFRTGFVWTPEKGVEGLLAALQRLRVPLPANVTEATLGSAMAVSADGAVVAGWGMVMPGGPRGWVARLR